MHAVSPGAIPKTFRVCYVERMSDVGRKVQVQVMFTRKLLERVDAIAEREQRERGDAEPNRSEVIRRLVRERLEAIAADGIGGPGR